MTCYDIMLLANDDANGVLEKNRSGLSVQRFYIWSKSDVGPGLNV